MIRRNRWGLVSLAREADDRTRQDLMRHGVAPSLESLAGWEFAGLNTNPGTALIGIQKFKKGFYEGPARAEGPKPFLQGYNVKVRQDAVDRPHVAKPNEQNPTRHAFFRAYPVDEGAKDNLYPGALLLDYGLGGNFALDPGALLRDYLVQVYEDDPDLLLGHAFVALGGLRISASYFVLRRMNRHDFKG